MDTNMQTITVHEYHGVVGQMPHNTLSTAKLMDLPLFSVFCARFFLQMGHQTHTTSHIVFKHLPHALAGTLHRFYSLL
jgi:hypothetical protein